MTVLAAILLVFNKISNFYPSDLLALSIISFLLSVATFYFAKVFEYFIISNGQINFKEEFRRNYDLIGLVASSTIFSVLVFNMLTYPFYVLVIVFIVSHLVVLVISVILGVVFLLSKAKVNLIKISLSFLLLTTLYYYFIYSYGDPDNTQTKYISILLVFGSTIFNFYLVIARKILKVIRRKRQKNEKSDNL